MLPRRATVSMIYNGANATEQVAGYINSFEYTDVASGKSDSIRAVMNDRDNRWKGPWFPVKGDKLVPTIVLYNWTAPGQVIHFPCGTFGVDDFTPLLLAALTSSAQLAKFCSSSGLVAIR